MGAKASDVCRTVVCTTGYNGVCFFFLLCYQKERISFSDAVGLISWRDGNALSTAHRQTDIDGGLVVEQRAPLPDSEVLWLRRATRDLYPDDEHVLLQAQRRVAG